MRAGVLSLFVPPYRVVEPLTDVADLSARLRGMPGAALIWCLEEGQWGTSFDAVRNRPGGIALIVILPRAEAVGRDPELLRIVELCRPHSILPYHPEPNSSDLRSLLGRFPDDLAIEVTDYLTWRGVTVDGDTRRLIRRTLELAGEIRSVSGLSRSLYLSRRALGRRFLTRGLPVPSHWLHFGRILRAALRLQSTDDTLFTIACDLGYPDGFALSNQMYRLIGIRPTSARDCLGWEWLTESWLRREAEQGGLLPQLFDTGVERSEPPRRVTRRRDRAERRGERAEMSD
jgi:AraC-like DNA-binding protein